VKDTGIGIEESNMGAIFEPFTQESITTTGSMAARFRFGYCETIIRITEHSPASGE